MDPTRTLTPAEGGPTATYRADPAGEVHVAPPPGTDPRADEELRTLLRKRLLVIGVVLLWSHCWPRSSASSWSSSTPHQYPSLPPCCGCLRP